MSSTFVHSDIFHFPLFNSVIDYDRVRYLAAKHTLLRESAGTKVISSAGTKVTFSTSNKALLYFLNHLSYQIGNEPAGRPIHLSAFRFFSSKTVVPRRDLQVTTQQLANFLDLSVSCYMQVWNLGVVEV
jgi:hypothetical protein